MSRKQKNRVGVIGLGQIGSKVSAGLRSAGFSVYVWNRSPKAEPNFLGSAIEVADLCDTIQLLVPDDAALDSVVRTIAAALRPSHVIIASTTTMPDTARELGTIVESAGARYVDAPFAGCRAEAEARQLVYYVGGSESAIRDARPVLQATSRSIVPVGAVGDASQLKLALQMLTAVTLEGLSEALAFARAGGLKPESLLDALEQDPSRSAFLSEKLSAMVKGNFEGGTPVRHLFRDLQLALKLSGSNPNAPATGVVTGLLFGAMRRGWAASDGSVLSRVFEPDAPPAPEPASEPTVSADEPPVPAAADVAVEPQLEPSPTVLATGESAPAEAANANGSVEMPMVELPALSPAEPSEPAPARAGVIPEKHGGGGINRLRRGLELIRTTPVIIRNSLRPTTTPAAPAPAPAPTTPPAEPATPAPAVPAARVAPPSGSTARIRPPQPEDFSPAAPYPTAPPESPNFPPPPPHRVNRRLNDTTNLQALLRSDMTPVLPDSTEPAAQGPEQVDEVEAAEPETAAEEITAEVLPPLPAAPAISPVIPGDIRPTQRVPVRSADLDGLPRPRMIRDPKSRSWIHRLIGS